MKNLLIMLMVVITLSACGTSTSIVKQSAPDRQTLQGLSLTEIEPAIAVPEDMRQVMREQLEHALYEDKHFAQGSELTVRYRFVGYNGGNRLKRWLAEGVGHWGEGSIVVITEFVDNKGVVIATLESLGRIDSGIFGGGIKSVAARVAEDIADYASHQFQ